MVKTNNVRDIYKALEKAQTHLIQSTEVATSCVCPYLFRLSYPFGVVRGKGDYQVANTAHDVMSLLLPTTILERWQQGTTDIELVARTIENDSSSMIDEAITSSREWATSRGKSIPETFENEVKDRAHGLLVGFVKRIMKKYEQPKKAFTELTITNVRNFQEGRVDGILEFSNRTYGLIDWKTYDINPASTGSFEKWQLVANMLLANYRYTGDEDRWEKCLFGSVVYYAGAYMPTMPIDPDIIQKIKTDRAYAHGVLCGNSPPTRKPQFCPVCDTGGSGSADCKFYRDDLRLAHEGRLPENYDAIRKLLVRRRYVSLGERAVTHRHKFALNIMIDRVGEKAALEELERVGIIQSGYKLESVEGKLLVLSRPEGSTFLEGRRPLRVIGKEEGIPLLACVNVAGSLREAEETRITIELFGSVSAARAMRQLSGLPIVVMPDEINLTRRTLEPMHKFHRLAADFLLPEGYHDG